MCLLCYLRMPRCLSLPLDKVERVIWNVFQKDTVTCLLVSHFTPLLGHPTLCEVTSRTLSEIHLFIQEVCSNIRSSVTKHFYCSIHFILRF